MPQDLELKSLTADIVAAYVGANDLRASDLPGVIATVHSALARLGQPEEPVAAPGLEKPTAAQIRRSMAGDKLISFVDGKPYATLKRHLSRHGMTMSDYRAAYGLPSDYPATSPSYSARRSELAISLGLGRKSTTAPAPEPKVAPQSVPAPKKRTRKAAPEVTGEGDV